jgi:serine/threonine protein kinase
MLCNDLPFGRPGNDVGQFLRHVKKDSPPPLSGIPPELNHIVMKMLAKSPRDRFQEPEAAARALAEFVSWTGVPTGAQELGEFLTDLQLPPPVGANVESLMLTMSGGKIPQEVSHEPTRDIEPNEVFSLHSLPPEPDPSSFQSPRTIDMSGQIHDSQRTVPASTFTCMSCGKPLKTAFSACQNCTGELELDHMKMRRKRDPFEDAPFHIKSAVLPKTKTRSRASLRWALIASCAILFVVFAALFWPELRAAAGR